MALRLIGNIVILATPLALGIFAGNVASNRVIKSLDARDEAKAKAKAEAEAKKDSDKKDKGTK